MALAGERPGLTRFLRGLAAGILVGAAIAGSTIWEGRRQGPRLPKEPVEADHGS